MKKSILAVILTALVLLFFAGCASKAPVVEEQTEPVTVEAEVEVEAEAEAAAE